MKDLSNRTAGFTDSVIRRMTRISNRYSAINLSQGFPDFEPTKEILKKAFRGFRGRFSSVFDHVGSAEFPRGTSGKTAKVHGN